MSAPKRALEQEGITPRSTAQIYYGLYTLRKFKWKNRQLRWASAEFGVRFQCSYLCANFSGPVVNNSDGGCYGNGCCRSPGDMRVSLNTMTFGLSYAGYDNIAYV